MNKLILCLVLPIYADVLADNTKPVVEEDADVVEIVEEYIVHTNSGPVRGYEMSDADVVQYFDIPYGSFHASDPFQEPSDVKPWEHILENQQHVTRCPQIKKDGTYIGTQECLTLSVFTPKESHNADVLFHIHDGDFVSGSGDPEVYSPNQLVPEGVILVLPNYRIGPLGFMCWRNKTVPGNAGLKDLARALKWTKINIEAFGGNASNIVVSGSGSGGALVDYLLIANESKPYISKAVTESGFALSHWAIDREPLRSKEFDIRMDTDLEVLIRELKNVSARPCIDGTEGVIKSSFWHSLHTQNLSIPIMMGSANQASMHVVLQLNEMDIAQINGDLSTLLPNDLSLSRQDKNEIASRMKSQYFGEGNITLNKMDELSLCFTDIGFLSPGVRQARALTRAGATVYFYEFSYTGDRNNPINGAAKGDSLYYVFSKNTFTTENAMRNTMTALWVNFIKKGIPTAENVQWPSFRSSEDKEECLKIGSEIKLMDGLHSERLDLWAEVYDRHFIENIGATLKPPMYIVYVYVLVTFNLILSVL